MSKSTAIKTHCKACAVNFKDVALCTDPGCPLWPHRLGPHPKSAAYRAILDNVKRRFPKDVADLASYGLGWSDFYTPLTVKGALNVPESTIAHDPSSPYTDEDNGVVFSEKMPEIDNGGENDND